MPRFVSLPVRAYRIAPFPVIVALSVILIGMVSLPGCGGGGNTPELGEVEGVVTLDGKPLPEAQVDFIPAAGRPSMAETDANGKYRLQYTADNEGAIVGPHTVKIHTAVDGRVDRQEELVPPRYHADTELKADVKAGSNEINFDLTSN